MMQWTGYVMHPVLDVYVQPALVRFLPELEGARDVDGFRSYVLSHVVWCQLGIMSSVTKTL